MKIFPQNAFPLPIIAHPKKNGHFLELLKKISVLKKNIGFLPEPFSPPYDWGSQWFVCRKSGQVMAVAHGPGAGAGPLLEHSRFGEQGCEKVSQKLVLFLQRSSAGSEMQNELCRASKPHPWLLPWLQSSFTPNSAWLSLGRTVPHRWISCGSCCSIVVLWQSRHHEN